MNHLQELAKFIKDVDDNPNVNIIFDSNDDDTAMYGAMKHEPLGFNMDLRLYMDSVSATKIEQMLNEMGDYTQGNYARDMKDSGNMYGRYVPKGDGQMWIVPSSSSGNDK